MLSKLAEVRRIRQCKQTLKKNISAKNNAALLGATNPLQSAPGTIRGDYAIV